MRWKTRVLAMLKTQYRERYEIHVPEASWTSFTSWLTLLKGYSLKVAVVIFFSTFYYCLYPLYIFASIRHVTRLFIFVVPLFWFSVTIFPHFGRPTVACPCLIDNKIHVKQSKAIIIFIVTADRTQLCTSSHNTLYIIINDNTVCECLEH